MMKNKKGKMVSVGGHNYAMKMAKMRKGTHRASKLEEIKMKTKCA